MIRRRVGTFRFGHQLLSLRQTLPQIYTVVRTWSRIIKRKPPLNSQNFIPVRLHFMLNDRHLNDVILHHINGIARCLIYHRVHATDRERQGSIPLTFSLCSRYFWDPITNVATSITRHSPLTPQVTRLAHPTLRINPPATGNICLNLRLTLRFRKETLKILKYTHGPALPERHDGPPHWGHVRRSVSQSTKTRPT